MAVPPKAGWNDGAGVLLRAIHIYIALPAGGRERLVHMGVSGWFIATATLAWATVAMAAGGSEATLVIKDHKFTPSELRVPAGSRVELTVDNQDATPEEFEVKTLHIEKVIAGGSKGVVRFGPLPAGTYPFSGEFHEDSAQGKVIVE
jgi:plastocyanin